MGSTFASQFHEATERHARCAEHGESLHVPEAAGDMAWMVTPRPEEDEHDRPRARPHTPADDGHEHEHCYLCPTSRDEHDALIAASSDWRALPATTRCTSQRSARLSHAALFFLAPKTSPPA